MIVVGVTPLKLGSDFTAEGHRVISAKLIKGRTVDLAADEARFVDTPTYRKWMRTPLAADDVILTSEAPLGEVAYLPADIDWVLGQRLFAIRTDKRRLLGRFLYYALQAAPARDDLLTRATGTTAQGIRQSELRRVRVPIPPLSAQLRIAGILGALDDKIELNLRTSEVLEAVARAIFRSWFIDDAPAGGSVRGLDEVARFLNGLALQRFPPTADRSLPVIKIAQLRSGDTRDADRASADLPADYVVRDGDVLFSWSGSLECVLWAGGKGALNQHLFKVTSADFPKWFYYLWIHQHLADFREIAAGKATTMGHIQRHHLADAKVSIPPPAVLASADRVLGPMIEQICRRGVEARTLADVRDALLPRLLSGQLTP